VGKMKKLIRIGALLLIFLIAVIVVGCASRSSQSPQNLGEQSEEKVGEFTVDDAIKATWEFFYGTDRASMDRLFYNKVIRLRGRVTDISSDFSLLWLGPFKEDWKEYSDYGTEPDIKAFSRKSGYTFREIKMGDVITLEGIFYARSFTFEVK